MNIRNIAIVSCLFILFPILEACQSSASQTALTSTYPSDKETAEKAPVAAGLYQPTNKPGLEGNIRDNRISPHGTESKIYSANLPLLPGSALIAVTRLFGTTLGTIDPAYRVAISPSAPSSVEGIQKSPRADRLAYLVLEGLNPTNNYIETVELSTQKTHHIKPKKGFAFLGFIIAPDGKSVAFTEVSLKGTSSRNASWHMLIANLEKEGSQEILISETPSGFVEAAPIPFAWSSRTGEIYLKAVRPFSGGWGQGIWAIRPDGSNLRQLMPETSFNSLPILSPDGSHFAYLASDVETLPPNKNIASPGAPPSNLLVVRDLVTGQERIITTEQERVFGIIAWSQSMDRIIASRQEWRENKLQDISLVSIPLNGSSQRDVTALPQQANVIDIFEYNAMALFWVNEGQMGTELVLNKRGATPASILTIPEGQIKIVGYLE